MFFAFSTQRSKAVVCLTALALVLVASVLAFPQGPARLSPTRASAQAEAAVKIPDTPAGRKFQLWLRVYNAGDYEALRAFHAANASGEQAERRALMDYRMYLQNRGFVPHSVQKSADHEMEVLGQERLSGLWVTVVHRYDAQPPHHLKGIGVRIASPPAGANSHGKMSDAEIVRQLESVMDRLVAADAFSGAVVVARDGKPIFKQAYGLASQAYRAPNRTDTKFNLASMGKMFTGVAVTQLAQQGKLSFQDTVGKHLPDYPNKNVAEKVTIHHLLTHTSGLGSYWNDKFQARKEKTRTVQDFLSFFVEEPPAFEPGQKWQYSNSGFIVLGAIIEKVSGQSYFDYVKEHIFKPAGMPNTDAYEMDRETPNLAMGYTRNEAKTPADLKERKNNLFLHSVKGGPAGGSFSTAEDLLNFSIALRKYKLLSPEYTALALAGKVETGGPNRKYAYGFQEEKLNGKRIVGHGGGFPGISTVLDMYLDHGYTVIVLSNYDMAAMPVARKLQEWITQE